MKFVLWSRGVGYLASLRLVPVAGGFARDFTFTDDEAAAALLDGDTADAHTAALSTAGIFAWRIAKPERIGWGTCFAAGCGHVWPRSQGDSCPRCKLAAPLHNITEPDADREPRRVQFGPLSWMVEADQEAGTVSVAGYVTGPEGFAIPPGAMSTDTARMGARRLRALADALDCAASEAEGC